MIGLADVKEIHRILIERFGGSQGIRDTGLLDSALNRPYQTFDGIELYSTAVEKAAAIFESIITNHPFVDGNKRTAYVLMRLILLESKVVITTTQENKYDFVIRVAKGELAFGEIKDWIQSNSTTHH